MSTLAQRLSAISDGLREVRESDWPAHVDWMDFDEAEVAFRVESTASGIVVEASSLLVRSGCDGTETIRHQEAHRFPVDADPQKVVENVWFSLRDVYDAIEGKDIPEGGASELVKAHRQRRLMDRALRNEDPAALIEFLKISKGDA